eukprot:467095_1
MYGIHLIGLFNRLICLLCASDATPQSQYLSSHVLETIRVYLLIAADCLPDNNTQSIVTTLLQLCRYVTCITQYNINHIINNILANVMPHDDNVPSTVLISSKSTPEMFVSHRIYCFHSAHNICSIFTITMNCGHLIICIETPSSIGFRP